MVVSYTKISRDTQYKYSHSNFIMIHTSHTKIQTLLYRYQNCVKVCDPTQTKPNQILALCDTIQSGTSTLIYYTFLLPPTSGQNFPLICGYPPTNYMAQHYRTYLDTNYHEKLKPASQFIRPPWWRRQHDPLKQEWCTATNIHGVTPLQTLNAMITWNLACSVQQKLLSA
jgi:hypothetical protein